MLDQRKTKVQLIEELRGMRQKISAMEAAEGRLLEAEKALRESEERFRVLYENAPLGYQSLDENGCFLEVNGAWLDLLGYSRNEVIGKWCGDFLTAPYREKFTSYFPQFKADGEIHGIEFEMVKKDGSTIFVLADGKIGRDEQGRFKQTHCILHDLTALRRTQAESAESENRYRDLFENAPVAIYELDLSELKAHFDQLKTSGVKDFRLHFETHLDDVALCASLVKILDINRECVAYFQAPTKQDVPRDLPHYFSEQSWDMFREHLVSLAEGQTSFASETVIRDLQGQRKIVSAKWSVLKGSERTLKRVLLSFVDVTERRRAEQALAASNRQWRLTFDAVPDFIMVVDTQHRIVRANKAMADALGMTEQELIGKLCFELVHGEKEPPAFCPHSQLLADGTEHSVEVVEPRLGATLDVRVSPIVDESGQVTGSVHVARDITERQKAEAAIRQQRDFLQQLMDTIPSPIFYKDVHGRYMGCNRAFESDTGFSRDNIAGKTVFDVAPLDLAQIYHEQDVSLLRNPGVQHGETRRQNASGNIYDVVYTKATFSDLEGNVAGLVGVIFDITERKQAEKSLSEKSQFIDSLLRAAPVPIFYKDRDGRYVGCNDAFTEIMGVSSDDIAGKTVHELWPGELADKYHQMDLELMRNREHQEYEYLVKDKDGAMRPVIYAKDVYLDSHGEVAGIVGAFLDITERKKAERELQQSNDLLRAIIEAAPTAIIGLDLDGNVQMVWNPAAEKMLGWSAEEAMGRPLPSVPAESQEEFRGFREAIRSGKTLDGVEALRYRRDGSPINYSIYASPLHDAKGRITGNVAVLVDTTERKRAEEQIKHAEEFLNTVVDNLPIAVFAKSAQNGQFMLWNKASEALFGFTKQQAIGKTDYDFFPKEQADSFWEKDGEAFASGEVIDIPEELILTKNLGTRILHTRKVPVYDKDGQSFCLLGISEDITDRKRAENIMLARLRLVEYATSHTLDQLLQATLDEVEALTDSLIGFYHFVDTDQRTLWLQAWSTRTLREMCTAEGKGLHYDINEAGVWADCVHERKPVIHNDYSVLPHRKGMPPGHANVIRELVVPVFRGERIVAVLGVGNKPSDYTASEIETVSLLADLAWDIAERKFADEKLRRSEAKFLDLYENAPCAYFSVGTDSTIRLCNRRAGELLGYSREELIGKPVFDLYVDKPEAREKAKKVFKRFLAGEIIADEELQMQKADGSPVWISLTVNGIRDPNGHLVESRSMVLDISERKRAEDALRRLNRELRAISNCNQVLLRAADEQTLVNDICRVICDEAGYRLAWVGYAENDDAKTIRPVAWAGFDSGYIADAKRSWADDTERGRGPAGIVIRSGETVCVQDFTTDPRTASWRESVLQRGYRSGVALPLKDESARVFGALLIYHPEPYAVTPDEICLMEALAGDLAFGINTLRARTERERAEEALRESEAFYRSLYENISDCIFTIDVTPEGRFKFVGFNPAQERAVGMTTEQVANRFVDDLVSKEVAEHMNSRYQMCVEERQTTHYEEELDLPKGKISFLTSLVPIEGPDGRIYRIIGVARDITEEKSLQRQLVQAQKMEAIGRLAGGVAHDFNNILTAIIGYSDVLTQQIPADSPYRSKVVQISRAGVRAADLTRQLLAFSRKQILDLRPLNLNEVIADFEKMLKPLIGEDIEVVTFLDPSVGMVLGDPTQIEQILLNLAVNARDAMPTGGKLTMETASVSLDEAYARTHPDVRPGPYVKLAVSDTGHGMDPQVLTRAFEPFFTTKEKEKGTGLGLSTVYGIVKQHQGHVTAYSEPDRGTTFRVYLPLVQHVPVQPSGVPATTTQLRGNETVLVVEDDEIVRQLTSEVLETLGYSVLQCGDPEEAKRICMTHQGPIHLLLTDVVLPQMDGKSLFNSLSPQLPEMRVLYVSGYAENAIVRHGVLDAGVKFLQKPFATEDLARKVREALDWDPSAGGKPKYSM